MRAAYNIGSKTIINVNGRMRIPYGLLPNVLSEVKNVANLSYTSQLRDFAAYARAENLDFDLYVRPTTSLSSTLIDAIREGTITLKSIP